MKKIVYVDMDGVIADFWTAAECRPEDTFDPPKMLIPGFFRTIPLCPGAKKGLNALLAMEHIDVYIASKPCFKNHSSYTDKADWIEEHFPDLKKKIFLTCDKSHLNGDFLIDDDKRWETFPGTLILFNEQKPEEEWQRIVEYFKGVK